MCSLKEPCKASTPTRAILVGGKASKTWADERREFIRGRSRKAMKCTGPLVLPFYLLVLVFIHSLLSFSLSMHHSYMNMHHS